MPTPSPATTEWVPLNTTSGPATPTAHHTSHEPGGADEIVNINATNITSGTINRSRLPTTVAMEDEANTFTQNPGISNVAPAITFNKTDGLADQKNWRIEDEGANLRIKTLNDAMTSPVTIATFNNGGELTSNYIVSTNDLAVLGNAHVYGQYGNVACKDQANTFTATIQTIQATQPELTLKDNFEPADAKVFRLANINQNLYIQALNDARSVSQGTVRITRGGDIFTSSHIVSGANFYEKGRAVPMGHWDVVDIVGYVHNASLTGIMGWTIIGLTMHMYFVFAGVLGAIPYVRVNLPASKQAAGYFSTVYNCYSASGAWHHGMFNLTNATYFDLYDAGAVAFPAGQCYLQGSVTFPIY